VSATATVHLNFRGDAREALAFYQSVFGGQVRAATYAQMGVPHDSDSSERAVFDRLDAGAPDADHLAFGTLVGANGVRLAAYDVFGASGGGPAGSAQPGSAARSGGLTHTESAFIVLDSETVEEARELWNGLSAGGTVIQNLAPTDWAPGYGMLADRFGVTWIFGVASAG
jgi:PhnB protein